MESTKFQLLASVFPGSCHLPLPFNALDAAELCLLHSAAPSAEGRQQCCSQNSRCCSSLPIVRYYCLPFLFFMNCHLKIYVTVPCAVIRSWADCARLEGKTQPPNCSNNHNVVGIFLATRSEEFWMLSVFSVQWNVLCNFLWGRLRVSALGPETRAIQTRQEACSRAGKRTQVSWLLILTRNAFPFPNDNTGVRKNTRSSLLSIY